MERDVLRSAKKMEGESGNLRQEDGGARCAILGTSSLSHHSVTQRGDPSITRS
jgi:hypothetical protein